jgi:hypothetical protein
MNVCRHYVTQLQWQWGVALGFILSAFQAGGGGSLYSPGVGLGSILSAFQAGDGRSLIS